MFITNLWKLGELFTNLIGSIVKPGRFQDSKGQKMWQRNLLNYFHLKFILNTLLILFLLIWVQTERKLTIQIIKKTNVYLHSIEIKNNKAENCKIMPPPLCDNHKFNSLSFKTAVIFYTSIWNNLKVQNFKWIHQSWLIAIFTFIFPNKTVDFFYTSFATREGKNKSLIRLEKNHFGKTIFRYLREFQQLTKTLIILYFYRNKSLVYYQ